MLLSIASMLVLSHAAAPSPRAQELDLRQRFIACAERGDAEACRKLWREHPYEVLGTIDEDLEGSLALWEKERDKTDPAALAALHRRALWGAELASEVFHTPIFHDYASSFVGWSDEQKANFRAGQRAHAEARGALKKGDFKLAAEKGRACRELALPLGDWWGTCMGLAVEGVALAADKQDAEASQLLSQANVLYRDLGLIGAQRECAATLTSVCERLKQSARMHAAAKAWVACCEAVGDEKGLAQAKSALERAQALQPGVQARSAR